ncbi:MAG: PilZ domain-containing protein [Gammaproteobacteria bacterium]|nr:PilZ domain-containing protein [Gammaproteobacteria bacterium]
MLANKSVQSNSNPITDQNIPVLTSISQMQDKAMPTVIIASNQRSVSTYINGILREIIKIDTVANVSSMQEASKLIEEDTDNKISCFLSTDRIDGGEAHELLAHLRETHQDSKIPFIMLTEKQEHELEDLLKDSLAMRLAVPFTAGNLIDKMFEIFKERDRRHAKRVASSLPCEIKDKATHKLFIDGKLHDISKSGCLIELSEYLDGWSPGDSYLIEFAPDAVDVIRLMAKVARTVIEGKKISVGFEFMNIDNNTKWNLEKFLKDNT